MPDYAVWRRWFSRYGDALWNVLDPKIMLIKPEFNPKAIRSFVIRAGRMTEGQKPHLIPGGQSMGSVYLLAHLTAQPSLIMASH